MTFTETPEKQSEKSRARAETADAERAYRSPSAENRGGSPVSGRRTGVRIAAAVKEGADGSSNLTGYVSNVSPPYLLISGAYLRAETGLIPGLPFQTSGWKTGRKPVSNRAAAQRQHNENNEPV